LHFSIFFSVRKQFLKGKLFPAVKQLLKASIFFSPTVVKGCRVKKKL